MKSTDNSERERMSLDSLDPLLDKIELRIKDSIIEIPLHERKKTISVRVLPNAISTIDKFILRKGITGNVDMNRTRLIERIITTLSLLILSMNYDVNEIVITVKNNTRELSGKIEFR